MVKKSEDILRIINYSGFSLAINVFRKDGGRKAMLCQSNVQCQELLPGIYNFCKGIIL